MTDIKRNSSSNQVVISAFGLTCLDSIVKIPNSDLLDKYDLPYNGQTIVHANVFNELLNDINTRNYDVTTCAGGCAQNTLRIFQWLIGTPNKTSIFGVVGKDDEMQIMKKQVENDGVITRFLEMENERTSRVLILAFDDKRCCVGIIGSQLIVNDVTDYPVEDDRLIIADSKILHTDGFFIYGNARIVSDVIRIRASNDNGRCLSFNLGATFIVEDKWHLCMTFATICDILFANRDEFNALIELNDDFLNDDDHDDNDNDNGPSKFVKALFEFQRTMTNRRRVDHSNDNSITRKWGKIVVITDGGNPVYCVYGDGKLCTRQVVHLDDGDVVDTTGAGDAFVAGFLYGLTNDYDIDACISVACKTAAEIVRHPGVFIPDINPRKIIVVR